MKKKVLFLIHALGAGGAEKILVNIANGMDKEKFDVTIMTVVNTGVFRTHIDDTVKYKYIFNLPFKKKNKAKAKEPGNLLSKYDPKVQFIAKLYTIMWKFMPVKLFYKLMIREKYDVEIAFLEGICAKIINGSSNKNSKKISWIHVDMINHKKSEAVFTNLNSERKCYENFDKIICVSKNVRDQFIKKFNYDTNKVEIKYNPVDKNDIIKKSKEEVIDLIKPNKFVFCTVGRLVTQKGYDRLLRVHNRLIKEGLDYELWIVGEGNKRPLLEQYIEENNLSDSIKLLGFKENPYKYIKLSDSFVCSSRAEGFSTVASEAVILGKPIVTVNCSGMHELLGENNEYGLVVDNNEDSLYEGMKRILLDKKLYEDYLSKVKERESIFDYNVAIKNIEELC
ncbi:glycosyltransferase [Clostridium sp.]|uniref:glycosyltransferase n=1 Tax=Clostridium sp. TaxID=1506 RepID=UPI00290AD23C|nr:glycosyltransferase [Clostridium sp.]MDU5107878.1 glycosyltransferase [Clostridium sp.]